MEHFFNKGHIEECNTSWIDETMASLSTKRSDFVPYNEQIWLNEDRTRCKKNVKMRMMKMLKGMWTKTSEAKVRAREKSIRHMVKERLRRQSHREGYMGLRAILPLGTKCDKISITTVATSEIIETRRMLEELRKRNKELKRKVESKGKSSKLRIKVGNPTSGIDSMAEVLHCLKDLGSDIINMQSYISDQEFTAEAEISSQIAEDEVEKAVQKTLLEAEKKLLMKKMEHAMK